MKSHYRQLTGDPRAPYAVDGSDRGRPATTASRILDELTADTWTTFPALLAKLPDLTERAIASTLYRLRVAGLVENDPDRWISGNGTHKGQGTAYRRTERTNNGAT